MYLDKDLMYTVYLHIIITYITTIRILHVDVCVYIYI